MHDIEKLYPNPTESMPFVEIGSYIRSPTNAVAIVAKCGDYVCLVDLISGMTVRPLRLLHRDVKNRHAFDRREIITLLDATDFSGWKLLTIHEAAASMTPPF